MRNIYDYIKDPIFLKKMRAYEHLDNEDARNELNKKMEEYFLSLPKEQQDAHNGQMMDDVANIIKMVDADIEDIKREKEAASGKNDSGRSRKIASITL